jgi:hypothetical protein
MAYYNREFYEQARFLEPCDNEHFGKKRAPGASVECAGIYRCDSCGFEIVREYLDLLPNPAICAAHDFGHWHPAKPEGHVEWRLVIALKNKPQKA